MIKKFQIKHLKEYLSSWKKNLQLAYFSVAKSFQKKSYSLSFKIIVSPRDWFQTQPTKIYQTISKKITMAETKGRQT